MADSSPKIGIYREVSRSGNEFTVRLEETLRGKLPKKVKFTYSPGNTRVEPVPRGRQRFLIAYQLPKRSLLRDGDGDPTLQPDHTISLTQPAIGGVQTAALLSNFAVERDGSKIEKIVRDRIRLAPQPFDPKTIHAEGVYVMGSEVDEAIRGNSGNNSLIIPNEFLPAARAWQEQNPALMQMIRFFETARQEASSKRAKW